MKKILLIEDHDDIRENTAELLDLEGYAVVAAKDGQLGIELAKLTQPDVIICDIRMAELDGYGVLHHVRTCESLKHTPFIFLTAMAEQLDKRKGLEMGAEDYITKPFEFALLLHSIEKVLSTGHVSNPQSNFA